MKNVVRYAGLALIVVALIGLTMGGCSDRVQGEKVANAKPQVYFVNIPPDGQKVSVNPVVFWVGTDGDGLIMQYRYVVVPTDEMGGMGPDEYSAVVLANADESIWTYLDVSVDTPRTTNEIPAQASLEDPVNRYIPQYIFVQAIDDQGMGSDIIFRLILRNDYPPDTEIRGVDPNRIYINDEQAGAIVTGVPIRWRATDPDLEDSLFQFEWRVLGPYTDAKYSALLAKHRLKVFVTNDANVYPFWQGEKIVIVDTTYDSTGIVVDSNIILVDTITTCNFFGCPDTSYLDMEGILADADLTLNKQLQYSGGWISGTEQTLYDLFTDYADDTTIVRNFIFWVRSRDQAQVADLTPDWTKFKAIEPKYERGPVVIDFSKTILRWNAPYADSTQRTWDNQRPLLPKEYWKDVIRAWDQEVGDNFMIYDSIYYAHNNPSNPNDSTKVTIAAKDYVLADLAALRVPLKQLLSHKLIILYNDDIEASGISNNGVPTSGLGDNIYTAIDAGVNAWSVMRAPIYGGKGNGAMVGNPGGGLVYPDAAYSYYFGVSEMVYSGWGYWAFDQTPNAGSHYEYTNPEHTDSVRVNGYFCDFRWFPKNKRRTYRIEDFVGAVSPTGWPELSIDSTLLHSRYLWSELFADPIPCFGWGTPYRWGGGNWPQAPLDPNLRALPEVNWASRVYGTELMYLYKSYYGGAHPLGEFYNFDGTPVAHRLDRGIFRTVHFCFTPMSMDPGPMQQVIDRVLDFLWNPDQFQPTSAIKYPGAKAATSISEERQKYLRGIELDLQRKINEGIINEDAHQ